MNAHNHSQLQAVVFDWAGTILDFGSCAPMGAFVKLFEQFGVDITIAEARGPMGMAKWDHIKALGTLPRSGKRSTATPSTTPTSTRSTKCSRP